MDFRTSVLTRRVLFLVVACAWVAGAQTTPMRPCDYFDQFLTFRYGAAEAKQISIFPVETMDNKNGFCERAMSHGGDRYTFVVWKTGTRDVFGFSEPSKKWADTAETSFWSYDGGKWIQRVDVAPVLDLRDFWDETAPAPAEKKHLAFFEFNLPRQGTTIIVRLLPACNDTECGPADELVRAAKYKRMDLLWDNRTGKFTKGPKRRE